MNQVFGNTETKTVSFFLVGYIASDICSRSDLIPWSIIPFRIVCFCDQVSLFPDFQAQWRPLAFTFIFNDLSLNAVLN